MIAELSSTSLSSLVVIAAVALVAPLIAYGVRGIGVPEVAIELVLGIILGPAVLGVIHVNGFIGGLSSLGLALLMFLAGLELDLDRVRGRPLRLASVGWVTSVVIALTAASALYAAGAIHDPVVVGLALTTTALSTLLPILEDAGVMQTGFGTQMLAVGAVGEFGPIVAVALFLTRKNPLITILLLAAFVVVAVLAALVAVRARTPRTIAFLRSQLDTTSLLPVRLAMFLVVLLVFLASFLGLDVLLGSFAAGMVLRLFAKGESAEGTMSRIEGIAFGFFVPVFFIVSGANLDIRAVVAKPSAILLIPVFFGLMLVARGLPALLFYRRVLDARERSALALLSSTGLPLIVVIASIGVSEGRLLPENAAALVCAGLLSVLVLPATGLRVLKSRSGEPATPSPDGAPA